MEKPEITENYDSPLILKTMKEEKHQIPLEAMIHPQEEQAQKAIMVKIFEDEN